MDFIGISSKKRTPHHNKKKKENSQHTHTWVSMYEENNDERKNGRIDYAIAYHHQHITTPTITTKIG